MVDSAENLKNKMLSALCQQEYTQAIKVINLFVRKIYIRISPSFFVFPDLQ